jgi:hypothetical protein
MASTLFLARTGNPARAYFQIPFQLAFFFLAGSLFSSFADAAALSPPSTIQRLVLAIVARSFSAADV